MDSDQESPPPNADDWSSEQWIEWLRATDEDPVEDAGPATRAARVVRSSGGQLLGNAMVGLASAIYGPQKVEAAIIVESDEPEEEQFVEVHLDYEHPDQSTAVVHRDAKPD